MTAEQILSECVARGKLSPGKLPAEIVDEVMSDLNGYKAALRARPEFARDPADIKPAAEEPANPALPDS